MFWNANGGLNDQHLLPEFLVEHRIDTALINENNLQPTKKRAYGPIQYIEQKDIDQHMEEQP
jgi:hypothetical protein